MTAAYKLHATGRFLRISRYSTCVLTYLRVIVVQGRGGEGVDMRNIILKSLNVFGYGEGDLIKSGTIDVVQICIEIR